MLKDVVIRYDGQPLSNLKQLVYCKDCKYRRDAHYEEKDEPEYIKSVCEHRAGLKKGYRVNPYDFCSRGEVGVYESKEE